MKLVSIRMSTAHVDKFALSLHILLLFMKKCNNGESGKTDTCRMWLLDYLHTVECHRKRKWQFHVGRYYFLCLQQSNKWNDGVTWTAFCKICRC